MSDDEANVQRVEQLLDALKSPNLAEGERAELERELDSVGRVLDPSLEGAPIVIVYSEMEAFLDWLRHRQGTIMPDFRALYQKKAEFDRRLLDEPPS
jgi:hypothetical protein